MIDFKTIHVFTNTKEIQIIKDDVNFKCAINLITTLPPAVDNIYSNRPKDSNASVKYDAINIFKDLHVDFIPKSGDRFKVKWNELDENTIEAFLVELNSKIPK